MGNEQFLLILLLWSLIGGFIGYSVGNFKGRSGAGFFWGFFLGPLGWFIVTLGPNMKPKCPQCGGVIVKGAKKCKNCGSEL